MRSKEGSFSSHCAAKHMRSVAFSCFFDDEPFFVFQGVWKRREILWRWYHAWFLALCTELESYIKGARCTGHYEFLQSKSGGTGAAVHLTFLFLFFCMGGQLPCMFCLEGWSNRGAEDILYSWSTTYSKQCILYYIKVVNFLSMYFSSVVHSFVLKICVHM